MRFIADFLYCVESLVGFWRVTGISVMESLSDMKNTRFAAGIFILFIVSVYLSGCSDKLLDPTQIGRFRPVPAVNVILESLGVAEETPAVWEGAEDPRPIDVMAYEVDYTFSPGDTIRISIYELLQVDVPFLSDYVVTETGKISIPEVGVVEAAGLTESQLEEEIGDILSPHVLKEPSITVFLLNSQQRTYSILGNGVPSPSRYLLPRYDFRLNDALATAGVATQFNISYIYVSRIVTGKEAISEPVEEDGQPARSEPEPLIVPEQEMLEIIAPHAQQQWPGNKLIIASAEMITDEELAEIALPEGFESSDDQDEPVVSAEATGRETIDEPINVQDRANIRWIFQDGRWVPVQIGIDQPERTKPSQPLEWAKDQTGPLPPEL